jgi:hypothetical protein
MNTMNTDHKQHLEFLLNRYGFKKLIQALASIMHLRAHHILADYKDKKLSDAWREGGDRLLKLTIAYFANKVDKEGI